GRRTGQLPRRRRGSGRGGRSRPGPGREGASRRERSLGRGRSAACAARARRRRARRRAGRTRVRRAAVRVRRGARDAASPHFRADRRRRVRAHPRRRGRRAAARRRGHRRPQGRAARRRARLSGTRRARGTSCSRVERDGVIGGTGSRAGARARASGADPCPRAGHGSAARRRHGRPPSHPSRRPPVASAARGDGMKRASQSTARPAIGFAREIVAATAAHGVEDFVLCPGSRSGPLAHALAEAASDAPPLGAPSVSLHVRIDERSAGFLAVGLARGRALEGRPRPVAVVTTSGTAVGNLMPAVMEAHHSGLPLLLLTADRPGELRGIGANQTTDQVGIFGTFVRHSFDVSAPEPEEKGGRASRIATRAVRFAQGEPERDDMAAAPGPVHVNIEFRDPLDNDGGPWPDVSAAEPRLFERTRTMFRSSGPSPKPLPAVRKGIVIAGDGAGDAARRVAEAHGWPLLAEPTSGARSGPNAIGAYVPLLRTQEGQELARQAHLVVVVGRPTLSRPITRLVDAAPQLFVAAHGARWREAPRHAERVLARVPDEWLVPAGAPADAEDDEASAWLDRWRSLAAQAAPRTDRWDPHSIAAAVIGSLAQGDLMILGSSGPIRAADHV